MDSARVFEDSLALRAKNLRFRGVGNPYAFLDGIGILPVKEFIYRGATIIDVAEVLNLPVETIKLWIKNNGYEGEIEEASLVSAEGYLSRGQKMLHDATSKFALQKAKLLLEHARFMASKKDKKLYGGTQKDLEGPAAVTYNFNIAQLPAQAERTLRTIESGVNKEDPKTLEHDDSEPREVIFSLDTLGPPPRHARNKDSLPHTNVKSAEGAEEKQTNEEKEKENPTKFSEKDRWDY